MDRDVKPGNDELGVRIGGEPERPREGCPGCGAGPPRVLHVDDFPTASRDDVLRAMDDGADFYECGGCGKRWAVVRRRAVKRDGELSLEPPAAPPREQGPGRRRHRSAEAEARRAVRKNLRLAGEALPPEHPPAPRPTAEERRRARNARKARRSAS